MMARALKLLALLLPVSAWAASPSVVTEADSTTPAGTNQTTHTITLPGSLSNGNLGLIGFCVDWSGATSVTPPTGWTQVGVTTASGANVALAIFRKTLTGSEGASTTAGTDALERSSHKAYQISGHDSGQAPEVTFASSVSNSDADPPSITPTGGSKDYLFVTFACFDMGASGSLVADGFPTNYTNTGQQNGDATTGAATLAWARRALTASSEDPAVFTSTPDEQWVAATVAIHPSASCSGTPTITDVDTDETVTATQANVVITLTNGCAAQGTGSVTLRQSGNSKTLSVDSWSDTSIQVDMSGVGMGVASGLLYGSMDIRVTNDATNSDDQAITVNAPSGTFYRTLDGSGLVTYAGDDYGSPNRLSGYPTTLAAASMVAMRSATGTGCVLGSITPPLVDATNEIVVNNDGSIESADECTGVDWDFTSASGSGGSHLFVGTVGTWALLGVPVTMGGIPITDHVLGKDIAMQAYVSRDYFVVGDTAISTSELRQLSAPTDTAINATPAGTAATRVDLSGMNATLAAASGLWARIGASGTPVRIKFVNWEANYLDLWEARTWSNNDDVSLYSEGAGSVTGISVTAGTGNTSGTPTVEATTTLLLHKQTDASGQSAYGLSPFQIDVPTIPDVTTGTLAAGVATLEALGLDVISRSRCSSSATRGSVLTQQSAAALWATEVTLEYGRLCSRVRQGGILIH